MELAAAQGSLSRTRRKLAELAKKTPEEAGKPDSFAVASAKNQLVSDQELIRSIKKAIEDQKKIIANLEHN
jgi:phosphoenolpyruvate-protein kinase (PTS system EI component)